MLRSSCPSPCFRALSRTPLPPRPAVSSRPAPKPTKPAVHRPTSPRRGGNSSRPALTVPCDRAPSLLAMPGLGRWCGRAPRNRRGLRARLQNLVQAAASARVCACTNPVRRVHRSQCRRLLQQRQGNAHGPSPSPKRANPRWTTSKRSFARRRQRGVPPFNPGRPMGHPAVQPRPQP